LTTDRLIQRSCLYAGLVFAVVAGFALSCAGTSSVRYGDRIDVSKYPKDIQEAYSVFAVKCSKCHTLARPLNARIRDPEHWVRYVTRMRRNPSSGINAKDAETILRFLLYYTQQVAAEEEGTSSAPEPSVVASPPPLAPEEPAARQPAAPAPGNPAVLEGPMTEPARESIDGGMNP
jgi:hypothetical protein